MLTATDCIAQPVRAMPRFWGLKQGDKFSVVVADSRRTDIVVDGEPEVTQQSSESMQIQFTAVDFERTGDVIVRAYMQRIERKPEVAVLAGLNAPPIFLRIQPDGKVSMLNPESRELLLASLTDRDPEAMNVLKKCMTDESIASWFSIPFWPPGPAESADEKESWERSQEVSLGTLGTLQMDMSLLRGKTEDNMSKLAITGKARFRPLVLPETETATFPFFSNVSIEIDEIFGTGQMYQLLPDENDAAPQRPGFESIEWTIRLHGEAMLRSPVSVKTKSGEPAESEISTTQKTQDSARKVTFRQTQHSVWTLQSFEHGNRRMFDDRMPIPVR